MLEITPAIQTHLASSEIRAFTLVRKVIDEQAYCFTECDVPIPLAGELYSPRGYKAGQISYSLARIVDSMSLDIDNLDDLFTAPYVGGNPQGSQVEIFAVALDEDYQLIGAYPDDHILLFSGSIDDWQLAEGKLTITIASDMVQWHQRTMRMQSSSCSWRQFKSVECGYSGAESRCNRSYARCQELGNTANFGGERWLPSIEGINLWWGKTPEVSRR